MSEIFGFQCILVTRPTVPNSRPRTKSRSCDSLEKTTLRNGSVSISRPTSQQSLNSNGSESESELKREEKDTPVLHRKSLVNYARSRSQEYVSWFFNISDMLEIFIHQFI